MASLATYASAAGTSRYAHRFEHLHVDHFRQRYGLWLSSIGIGTYLGSPDPVTDHQYVRGVMGALRQGCNVVDTAVNYRHMRSEWAVGYALEELFTSGTVQRDEVVVCTKGGFVPFDGEAPKDRQADNQARFYRTGLATPTEIVGDAHCMTPDYLSHQIDVSLANLNLETIDVYYLHNPEFQLQFVSPGEFKRRLRDAFARLEAEVRSGRIRFYGIATWQGLLANETDVGYLPLSLLMQIAEEAGGSQHRFRFVQFPYNLNWLDAFVKNNQYLANGQQSYPNPNQGQTARRMPMQTLAAAFQLGLVAVTSASLMQTRVLGRIPTPVRDALGSFATDAQYALQFNRSTPGVTTALVGMRQADHALENMEVALRRPLGQREFFRIFSRSA